MVVILILGWLMSVWWVPGTALPLWLSAGFALFAILLVMPSLRRHWCWLPLGSIAGLVLGFLMV